MISPAPAPLDHSAHASVFEEQATEDIVPVVGDYAAFTSEELTSLPQPSCRMPAAYVTDYVVIAAVFSILVFLWMQIA